MVAFVDVAKNFVSSHTSKGNNIELCKILQDSIQWWDHLLPIYIIRWTFKEDGIPAIDNVSHYNIPITSSIDGTISKVT